jgi:DNA-directed RNA polymerase specialized sigma24 family protein
MHPDEPRPARGVRALFESSGLFKWRQCLLLAGQRLSPTRSVFAVGQCLVAAESQGVNVQAASERAIESTILTLLDSYRDRYAHGALPGNIDTWGPQGAPWWKPREFLADLISVECGNVMLKNTRRRMSERGINVGYPELSDLAAVFSNDYLPGAMRSFDPQVGERREDAWVTTVFFRYAAPRVQAMARNTVAFEDAFGEEEPWVAADPKDQEDRELLLQELLVELNRLALPQKAALQLYFGIGAREHTLAEVAFALGKSVHFVRTAITTGLGSLTCKVAPDRWPDPQDAVVARLLFAEGKSAQDIARVTGSSARNVKLHIQRLSGLLRSSMRLRTVPKTQLTADREESMPRRDITMGFTVAEFSTRLLRERSFEQSVARPGTDLNRLLDHLDNAEGEGRAGRLEIAFVNGVSLGFGDHWLTFNSLEGLRTVLRSDDQLYDRVAEHLERAGLEDELATVFAPEAEDLEPPSRRTDISDEQRAWSLAVGQSLATLDSLAKEHAEHFLEFTKGEFVKIDRHRLTLALTSALPSVMAALEDGMPWPLRKAGEAVLLVWASNEREEGQVYWAWSDDRGHMTEPSSLVRLVYQRLDLIGKVPADVLVPLTYSVCMALAGGVLPLPGLALEEVDNSGRRALRWTTPTAELIQEW